MGSITYVPSQTAMSWLWSRADSTNEAAAKPNERRKVCVACRSKADRSRRGVYAARLRPIAQ